MNINKLPCDIKYSIMSYLEDDFLIYKKLYSKKIDLYKKIYSDIMNNSIKAYVVSGPSSYTRNKDIDFQIHQFSNYLYLSNEKLLADFGGETPMPTYLEEKINSLNIFIYEIIKIIKHKNTLQHYYPGKINDVIITIENRNNNEYFKKINKNLTIEINSFS